MGTRTPPRFVTQTMATTFGTVVLILVAVLVVVTLIVRDQVRSSVIAHLTTQQGMLRTLEARRMSEMQAQAGMLAESPTVKAAMDTYHAESMLTGVDRRQLLDTVGRQLDELAERIDPDIVAVVDPAGAVIAAAGRRRGDWPRTIARAGDAATNEFIVLSSGVFRVATAPMVMQQTTIGFLQLGAALDADYAAQLSALSGAGTLITSRGRVVASTLPVGATRDLTQAVLTTLPESDEQFDVEVVQALANAIPTLRMDDNRYDTAAARAARKSSLVAFTRS